MNDARIDVHALVSTGEKSGDCGGTIGKDVPVEGALFTRMCAHITQQVDMVIRVTLLAPSKGLRHLEKSTAGDKRRWQRTESFRPLFSNTIPAPSARSLQLANIVLTSRRLRPLFLHANPLILLLANYCGWGHRVSPNTAPSTVNYSEWTMSFNELTCRRTVINDNCAAFCHCHKAIACKCTGKCVKCSFEAQSDRQSAYMADFVDWLNERVRVLDGGFASELEANGFDFSTSEVYYCLC